MTSHGDPPRVAPAQDCACCLSLRRMPGTGRRRSASLTTTADHIWIGDGVLGAGLRPCHRLLQRPDTLSSFQDRSGAETASHISRNRHVATQPESYTEQV